MLKNNFSFKAILFTLLFIVISKIASLWLLFDYAFKSPFLASNFVFINVVIEIIIVAAFLYFYKGFNCFKLSAFNKKYLFIAIALGFIYPYFQIILNMVYWLELPNISNVFSFRFQNLKTLNVVAAILLFPIVEEFYFRHFIQGGLQKKYSPFISIIVASLLFGFIHLAISCVFFESYNLNYNKAYITFFGGLIAGTLYYKSKLIIPAIIFHMSWNLMANLL